MTKSERLIQFRIQTKLSQERFAAKLDMTRYAYMPYEKDKRAFGGDFLIKLYETYEMNPLWLLTGNGEMQVDKSEQTNSLEENLQAKDYQLDYKGDRLITLVSEAQKVDDDLENSLQALIIEKVIDKIFIDKGKVRAFFHNDNHLIVLFIKIISNAQIPSVITGSGKEYLIKMVEQYKLNIFYSKKSKSELLDMLSSLSEEESLILLKNIQEAASNAHTRLDDVTKLLVKLEGVNPVS